MKLTPLSSDHPLSPFFLPPHPPKLSHPPQQPHPPHRRPHPSPHHLSQAAQTHYCYVGRVYLLCRGLLLEDCWVWCGGVWFRLRRGVRRCLVLKGEGWRIGGGEKGRKAEVEVIW